MQQSHTTTHAHCAQCGRASAEVESMIGLENQSNLCGECIDEIHSFMQNAKAEAIMRDGRQTPKDIVSFLDEYVIGQEEAKKTIAIAVYNHYKRLGHQGDVELSKSNILLLGPTGTGKTLLAQSVARLLDVPFTIADATSLTQAGYVGDDVETIIQRLIQAADGDIEKAERGIIFIDEIDKLAKAGSGPSITRDVSGEGVQQSLLKIIEGTKVSVQVTGSRKHPGANTNIVDTTNILFICSGAFVSLLEKLEPQKEARGLGFFASTEPAAPNAAEPKEVTPEMLFDFGMIPEFVGRLPVIATLTPLDEAALSDILVKPKNAVVRQMQELFAMEGASLTFEDGALAQIASRAIALKTGARGARSIIETLLKNAQFEVPGTHGATVTVHADLTVTIDCQQAA